MLRDEKHQVRFKRVASKDRTIHSNRYRPYRQYHQYRQYQPISPISTHIAHINPYRPYQPYRPISPISTQLAHISRYQPKFSRTGKKANLFYSHTRIIDGRSTVLDFRLAVSNATRTFGWATFIRPIQMSHRRNISNVYS